MDYGDWKDEKRSRSRTDNPEPAGKEVKEHLLPIKEKGRGRSPTDRIQRIADQMAKAHDKALVKGQMRMELGRFAAAFAKRRAEPAAAVTESRPASVKPTRTFDEIADMEVPLKKVPFGAGLSKQRTTSEGALRLRYQGRLVK